MALFILYSMNKVHCQAQNSMNKAIVKLKTVWIKPLSNSKDNGFIHTILSLTMALFIQFWVWQCTLFILFWVWQWLYSYCFEFDNDFIHTVKLKTVWVKHIVKLKTVWIKPLSNSNTLWIKPLSNSKQYYCFEFDNGFIHTVLSLTMALFILFLSLTMALFILFWVWQCVLLILFWVWQWIKPLSNSKQYE
jgi:ABC-type multidrug transport system fused ATPase/permease subunit